MTAAKDKPENRYRWGGDWLKRWLPCLDVFREKSVAAKQERLGM